MIKGCGATPFVFTQVAPMFVYNEKNGVCGGPKMALLVLIIKRKRNTAYFGPVLIFNSFSAIDDYSVNFLLARHVPSADKFFVPLRATIYSAPKVLKEYITQHHYVTSERPPGI
jgi:hypothetical protein